MTEQDIIVIGGGAAGFFAAINTAEMNPDVQIIILERGKEVLSKVRVSGGGRCNVTHAEFLPKELAKNYPRGRKELRGPFHNFMTGDTIAWFEERGVELKTEEDGRMFPVTNSSRTIIDCFLREMDRLDIPLKTKCAVKDIREKEGKWEVLTSQGIFLAKKVLVATGSNSKMWKLLEGLGHKVVPGVPSLFTFNIEDPRIRDLAGVATEASVGIVEGKEQAEGPLLITHWGMSGPAILKLSAWGARELSDRKKFRIRVNWLPSSTLEEVQGVLLGLKQKYARQHPSKYAQFELPKRLWQKLVEASGVTEDARWADINKKQLEELTSQLISGVFEVHGKSTFKEEFVTAGGVDLKEVNFKTFESKICKNLFFAGEVLNIDAITGGFNFQNAWTGGFLASRAMSEI